MYAIDYRDQGTPASASDARVTVEIDGASVTVPAGFILGMPVGVSFFGRAWSEPVLLRIAFAFEQATRARRSPRFLPTIEHNGDRLEPAEDRP